MGSGTTLRVAQRMGRNAIGIEVVKEYCELASEQLVPRQMVLLQNAAKYVVKSR